MGDSVALGVAAESVRGTGVTPSIWIPARTPSGIMQMSDKVLVKEARGSGIDSQANELIQTRAEGDLEFNVRNVSIGYILKSLLGSVGSVTASGATTHTFNVLTGNPQHPSLTLGLAQPGQQAYEYALAVVNSLEIRTPVDDLVNATASFLAKGEATHAAYTVSDTATDVFFRPQDITIKLANDTSGLAAASALCVKEFSMTIANNSRVNQCIGSLSPSDVLALIMEITGSFTFDYAGTTYYDLYKSGGYQAMQITMERDDLAVLGSSALYPKIQITLPRISFNDYKVNRPIDDIVTEEIGFTAHYDTTAAKAITVVVQNTQANYTT